MSSSSSAFVRYFSLWESTTRWWAEGVSIRKPLLGFKWRSSVKPQFLSFFRTFWNWNTSPINNKKEYTNRQIHSPKNTNAFYFNVSSWRIRCLKNNFKQTYQLEETHEDYARKAPLNEWPLRAQKYCKCNITTVLVGALFMLTLFYVGFFLQLK